MMTTMFSDHRSHVTLWLLQAVIAINMIWLSGRPLVDEVQVGWTLNALLRESALEVFLRGPGVATLGFWIKVLSVVSAVGILLLWPRVKFNRKRLRIKSILQFWLFFAFMYVTSVVLIFNDFQLNEFLWVQPVVYGLIFGIGYLQTELEVHQYNGTDE